MASTGEDFAALVDTKLKSAGSWSTVVMSYGVRELQRNQTYPRVVWVPIGGAIAQTKYPGGRVRATDVRAKMLRTGLLNHDIFIAHTGFENTENLWKAMVASIVIEGVGAIELGDFEWVTETQAPDFSVDGYMIRQRLVLRLPIHDDDIATIAVTGQDHTGTFEGESGDIDVC